MDKAIIDKDLIMSVYTEKGMRAVKELYAADVIITMDELSNDIDEMLEEGCSLSEIEERLSNEFN